MRTWLLTSGGLALLALAFTPAGPAKAELAEKVKAAEKERIKVINTVKPAVVAVMARDGRGGLTGNGSGVLISDDGYALTNWHVTNAARSPLLKCGLPDGKLYDAVLVGLDRVGDVALIKLLPPKDKADYKFPFAKMGDSDKVRAGDWSLAMGNPFSLATDFTPTVTYGMVSGVHRYQYPAGTLLEYTDCIQVDTSINPGNSGGPLFNMKAELIGINGRISLEKRGRVNVGVGYAISVNQIKNFMGHLKAGMDSDHASLGASMESENEEGALSKILVKSILKSCDAARRGLDTGDELITFGLGMGDLYDKTKPIPRSIRTVNQYKNVLGLYPKGWRVPLTYRRKEEDGQVKRDEILVRLQGVQRQEIPDGGPQPKGPRPQPQPVPNQNSPAAKFFKAKAGFVNYYFNEQGQKALLANLAKGGDFTKKSGDWKFTLGGKIYLANGVSKLEKSTIEVLDKGADQGKSPKVNASINGVPFDCEPLGTGESAKKLKDPPETGGLLVAMYQYRLLLATGAKSFREFSHGGVEPFYPSVDDAKPDFLKIRVLCEVLVTQHAGVPAKWYFATEDDADKRWQKGQLIGFEVTVDKDEDPCEVCLMKYKGFGGLQFPSEIHVRYGGKKYADFTLTAVDAK